jgi:predicted transcriptional regulator
LELKDRKHLRKGYLNPAVEADLLALTIPDKPKSSKQKYRLTEKGKMFLKNMQVTPEVTPQVIKLLEALQGEMSGEELLSKLELKDRKHLRKEYLNPAVDAGLLALTIPDKPNSSSQKYRLTEKGKMFLKNRTK